MRKSFILTGGIVAMAAVSQVAAGNLMNLCSGFEKWDAKNNLPFPAGRWSERGNGLRRWEIFEQSERERHSGAYSLHLKDVDQGKSGASQGFTVGGSEIAGFGGRILRFSSWIKQVSASPAKAVGVALFVKDKQGKTYFCQTGIDATGETPWQQVETKIRLPKDPALVIALFCCAAGAHATGEAYFDDAVLTVDVPPQTPQTPSEEKTVPNVSRMVSEPQGAAEEAYRNAYRNIAPVNKDQWERPEIRNGTWYTDGKPVFFVGPWIYNQNQADWNAGANPLKIEHPAYTIAPGKKIFDIMGFNSAQISAAHPLPGQARYGLPLPQNYRRIEQNIRTYYTGFQNVPLILDFAFGFDKVLRKNNPAKAREIDQRNPDWHRFIPFCPEHPEGDRYYQDYFLGGIAAALKNNANIFVYEIFNESSYNCQCRFNAHDFAARMQKKYGDITAANTVWGTVFDDFNEVAKVTHFQQYQGLWAEWCKFNAQRYAELLRKYRHFITSVDRRPHVYFSEQPSGVPPHRFMDYRLIAKELDVLALEGGWRYGYSGKLSARNDMEDVVMAGSSFHSLNCDFFQAITGGKKPFTNNEHYCFRVENGERVPSKKSDMITSLWLEVMHGSSGNYTYCYDKRSYDWRTFEEARQKVLTPSFRSSSLLNPYNWPVSELDAFQIFNRELAPYKDLILPFPRTKPATVAIFYSYPTQRMMPFLKYRYNARLMDWYAALLHVQYPVKIIFEEELAAGLDKEIGAVVFPAADYVAPEMLAHVAAFRRRGGLAIAANDAFRFDEYGRPLSSVPDGIVRMDGKQVSELPSRLSAAGVKRYALLTPADGKMPINKADVQIIDRGDFKLICIAAMGEAWSRLATLTLNFDDGGEFYLNDAINRYEFVQGGSRTWNAAALKRGVLLLLPPQERVILTLKRTAHGQFQKINENDVRDRFAKRRKEEAPAIQKFREMQKEQRRKHTELRNYSGVPVERCRSVDLRKYVNMAFQDKIAGDRRGGWFDQGNNDFSDMPLGKHTLAGVPFDIIDPATNNGKAALILRGTPRPWFPREVLGIPVGLKAAHVYFLHTMGWDGKGTVLTYRIHYDNGSTEEIPVIANRGIGSWWGSPNLAEAKLAVEVANRVKDVVNLQCFRWNNPHRDRTITAIDIVSSAGDGVPAVVGITVEQP